jgi:hypothetical protein
MKRQPTARCAVLLLAALIFALAGCEATTPLAPVFTAEDDGDIPLRPEEETAGNHLSLPVIWSDPYSLPLPGTFGVERFEGRSTEIGGVLWYHQKDEDNEWQAESSDWSGSPVDVTYVDWGDNLEAKNWNTRSKVRVEVVLFQDLTTPLTGYEMSYISGQGQTEVWGTNGVQYDSYEATVYSHNARLVIQKLPFPPDKCLLDWDPSGARWQGDAGEPLFNGGVWEGGDGPGYYSAEINVGGKVIYGYNWDVKKNGEGAGHYRITFALDPVNGSIPLNTFFQTTQVKLGEEVPDGGSGGGVAAVDHANNLSYIDIEIVSRSGGSAGGGGGGGNGGGGF